MHEMRRSEAPRLKPFGCSGRRASAAPPRGESRDMWSLRPGRRPRVAVVSPPFLSHAQPLSVLAGALARAGADVQFASAPLFEPLARSASARFFPLTITRNANTGIARSTRQGGAGGRASGGVPRFDPRRRRRGSAHAVPTPPGGHAFGPC